MEPILTTQPPLARSNGRQPRVSATGASQSTAMTWRNTFMSVRAAGERWVMPALLISTSSRPPAVTASIKRSRAGPSVRSTAK